MFRKIIYIFVAIVLAKHLSDASVVKNKSKTARITPYTLYEDALVKLTELKEIVNSAVVKAHNNIDDVKKNSADYAVHETTEAEIELQDEAAKIHTYIQDMVDLVENVGEDPSYCVGRYRPEIDKLLSSATSRLESCISDISRDVDDVYYTGLSDIDSSETKVADVEAQLLACSQTESILCISPVVRQIDEYKIELPETIELLIPKYTAFIETLTIEMDDCKSSSITAFVTNSQSVLDILQQCFDAI